MANAQKGAVSRSTRATAQERPAGSRIRHTGTDVDKHTHCAYAEPAMARENTSLHSR
jgi:hypothetical protein